MRAALLVAALAACAGSSTPRPAAPPDRTAAADTADPAAPRPPVAARRDHDVPSPHGARNDPYYWLRDDTRTDPDVLAYLEAENAYTRAVLAPLAPLEETLFAEMRGRIQEDDATVPILDGGYWYYTRFETGKQQPIHARRKGVMTAPEEILLDGNQLAAGHAYYRIGRFAVSRNGRLLAWADDTVGRNQYVLHVKDLATGAVLPDTATNVAPILAWANDDKTLFYTGKDEATLRADRVFRHVVGTAAHDLVYQEPDGSYYVGVATTKSRRYVLLWASATTNTEIRLVDADRPASPPVVFLPREKDHEYTVDHLDGRFVMRTNAGATNFRVVSVPEGKQADRRAWQDVIPHRADVFVEDVALFHDFIAATVRTGGMSKVMVLPERGASYLLDAQDPAYTMSVVDLPDAASKRVRYAYTSLVAPESIFEADVATRKAELLKQQPVPGFDPSLYASEYLHATATDGTRVPISVVYKKTTPRDGTAPLLVYGYGSYGASLDAAFQSSIVSLLDRGWVYALAHVRGGQELGRAWYEDGKLLRKQNTFTDFIAATEHLVAQRFGARDQVYARGGSAGGLLMGAIANLRPDLYRGISAPVPFVDVVTTMLDTSIPLTTNEFDEWGNPTQREYYDYMLAYSPYDNVRAQAYPAMYVFAGLWDSQVQYYEPAKWVAKLRATKTDENPLVFDVDMKAGHAGASGRFDRLRQIAREAAFLLHLSGTPDRRPGWPPR